MAANQVTVTTPGPAGPAGLVYEGLWVAASVYQVRDVVRYSDMNLYICNVQHTSENANNPTLNSTYWTLFINAKDAFQWATEAKHSQITDSLSNTGYSALHQAAKAADWATKVDGEVTNDANASLDPDGFSAKAYAIGGTGVTTTSGQGAAKEWATTTGGAVDTSEFSAKEYAQGTTATGGSAKEWAQDTSAAVATTFSAKEYAQGTQASTGGSAKNWATQTGADVTGGSSGDMSSKEWAVGTLGRGVSGEGSSKDWATRTGAAVDDAGFSAKEFAIGTTASTGGSAKDYATYVGGGVRGATSDHSAKAWSVGGTGVTTTSAKGAAKEWATTTGGFVDTADFSAKEFAIGTLVPVVGTGSGVPTGRVNTGGSAKDFASYTGGGVRGHDLVCTATWGSGTITITLNTGHGSALTTSGVIKVGMTVTATNIPAGTTVKGIASNNTITMTAMTTGTGSGATVTFSELHSAKAWAVGGTGVTTTFSKGSAKDWATKTNAAVDNSSTVGDSATVETASEFSAKEYAQGTQASTGGSSKSWSQDADGVNGAGANDRSAKAWSQGASMTGATLGGSSKDWASLAVSTGTVDGTLYSSKAYAQSATAGTSTYGGSAKGWASTAYGAAVPGAGSGDRSALHYSTDASNSAVAAKNSAAAVANSLDAFDDTYLGTMSDSSTQGTNPTTTGTWVKDSSAITVASGTNIKVGQVVTGTGMPSPPPNVISVAGTAVVVSENMAAAGNGVSLTFTGYGVYGTYNATKDGPTTDNDNGALADGMLYFNTTDNNMMVYKTTGAQWIAATASGGVSLVMHKAVASGSETSFAAGTFSPTLSYEVNNIVVWLNGVKLDATDYTATTGTSITGLSALAASDELVVLAFKTFEVGDAVSAASGGTFAGAVTFTGRGIHNGGITVANDGQIGSVGDADSIAISSAGVVTMSQIPVFSAGINVSGGTIAGTLATAAQGSVTSLGTLTALTVDDVAIDGKVLTMTGSASDTAVLTAGTNGTLSIVTTDAAAAAANIQITADGTVDIDSAGVLTLDSGAAINIEPASGSAILLDGTISVDAGVVTGATSITSTAFVGALTGNVTGNASGTAATVTGAAQSAITSVGALTTLHVQNATDEADHLRVENTGAGKVGITFKSNGSDRCAIWQTTSTARGLHIGAGDASTECMFVDVTDNIVTVSGDLETSTTGKVKQKGAFMQSSTNQSLILGY